MNKTKIKIRPEQAINLMTEALKEFEDKMKRLSKETVGAISKAIKLAEKKKIEEALEKVKNLIIN